MIKAIGILFLGRMAREPAYETGRFYYDQGVMRVEMMLIGSGHGQDNAIANQVVTLYTALNGLRVRSFINTSFRRSGPQECQPDLAFYLGSDFKTPPKTSAPVDVDEFGPPTLVIEIASTTLADDLGQKRLLYERLGIREYWVVNGAAGEVVALAQDTEKLLVNQTVSCGVSGDICSRNCRTKA